MAGVWVVLYSMITITAIHLTENALVGNAQDVGVGVCFGQNGDNLPALGSVVALYNQYHINKMRIYQPDPAVLDALRGTGIRVVVGTYNTDVAILAQGPGPAQSWFAAHIQPYLGAVNVTHISVGNEVYPAEPSVLIAPAMTNLQGAVDAAGFHGLIKVTTVVSMQVLLSTFPPSASVFADPAMAAVVGFLQSQGSELLVNVYPYIAYADSPGKVRLDYAQDGAAGVVVQDGALGYNNLFDAMVDSFYWAMEKAGAPGVGLVVAETGWPHGGAVPSLTTLDLAATYNTRLVRHLESGAGTPKRPNVYLQGYIFAMFDEDQKQPAGIEQFWGIFQPSGLPNYNPF
ncbi:hypothetical protein V2J09_017706 [Rumex salicifolius]